MPKDKIKDRLIVALDVENEQEAKKLVDELLPTVKIFKVGSLFTLCGHQLIQYIYQKGGRVFLDLKWFDIPRTVYNFVSTSTASTVAYTTNENFGNPNIVEKRYAESIHCGVFMMTVHILGGKEMLEAAIRGAKDKSEELKVARPFIVGVTVLTSENPPDVEKEVLKRAKIAKEAGLDGVVCSVLEAAAVRKECGEDFLIVTPGIRPQGAAKDDQARIATAKDAIRAGADFIVVGRPIIEAKNPKLAAQEILQEIETA